MSAGRAVGDRLLTRVTEMTPGDFFSCVKWIITMSLDNRMGPVCELERSGSKWLLIVPAAAGESESVVVRARGICSRRSRPGLCRIRVFSAEADY